MISEEHILVVDDDIAVLETICDGLLMHGFNVIPAKSPSEALIKIENKNISITHFWRTTTKLRRAAFCASFFSEMLDTAMKERVQIAIFAP